MKPMVKMLSLVLSLLTVQTVMMAGSGRFVLRREVQAEFHAPGGNVAKPGPLAYAIALDAFTPLSRFGVLDISTGVFHLIADLPPDSTQGIARDAEGKLYGVDSGNNLFQIDPGNGKARVIGGTGITTPGPKGPMLVDVIASLADGELFLMDFSNNLYSVNRETGAATLIGATGIPTIVPGHYSSSLAGDCDNLFFTLWEVDGEGNTLISPTLYRIDPRTAATTPVGPTATFMPGSGFIDGTLYGFTIDTRLIGFTEGPHVLSIDISTGATTIVSDLNVPGLVGAVRFAGVKAGTCKGSR